MIEMLCERDGCFIIDLLVLFDANYMLYTSEVEQKASEFRVTAGYEHEFKRSVKLFDELNKLLFRKVMGTAFVGFKYKAVCAVHRIFICHTVPRKVDAHGIVVDAEAEELLDRCLNVADFYSHTRILHALDSAFELSIKIQLGHLRDKTLPCGLFLYSAY
jgi:hypothetical protein